MPLDGARLGFPRFRSVLVPLGGFMTAPISRRSLLAAGTVGGLGIVLGGNVEAIAGPPHVARTAAGYGDLIADPAGILSLPPGFSYRIVAAAGQTLLESGQPTPSDADGTAAFPSSGGGFTLVNNHEIDGSEPFGVPALPGLTY